MYVIIKLNLLSDQTNKTTNKRETSQSYILNLYKLDHAFSCPARSISIPNSIGETEMYLVFHCGLFVIGRIIRSLVPLSGYWFQAFSKIVFNQVFFTIFDPDPELQFARPGDCLLDFSAVIFIFYWRKLSYSVETRELALCWSLITTCFMMQQ